ncbi:hypothetical protein F2P79_013290 [Pimephales promelas]|nr:hypothetical protein F2P79_013290 [Pimephales promelas]
MSAELRSPGPCFSPAHLATLLANPSEDRECSGSFRLTVDLPNAWTEVRWLEGRGERSEVSPENAVLAHTPGVRFSSRVNDFDLCDESLLFSETPEIQIRICVPVSKITHTLMTNLS